MAGKKGQKKRFWADEEKREICAQATGLDVLSRALMFYGFVLLTKCSKLIKVMVRNAFTNFQVDAPS